MNMKARINKLARKIEGDPNGECKCPGVETTFAVTSSENPTPPPQDICQMCRKRMPQFVVKLVYDDEVAQHYIQLCS
jgi:hypothetical protein